MLTRSRVAAFAAAVGIALLAEAPIRSQALSPRTVDYDIDVTLDPSARTITGIETIDWRNQGTIAAYSLRIHLYWNAFRNTNSTWLKQYRLGGGTGFDDRPESDFGRIDISSLQILGAGGAARDLTGEIRFISPDDQNADDRTLAAVTLPAAVAPGESLKLRIAWTGKFPYNFDRTGVIGNYFFVSQWFPKLGVFENGGWNARQFFANTEFFSDFGRYDVRMTVPDRWIVGATGVEQSRTPDGKGGTTHRYVQDDVHDFAWTTSPDFVERVQRFEHPTLPPVEMRLLLQPEHADQADRHFAGTAAALRYYGEWYGRYPYGHITIVDPAYQSQSDGMEYPTLFTGGTRWLAPRQSNEPEYVVIHEAGHQFWYGMVANNEVDNAWMDEGLNEFTDSRVQTLAFQPNYLVQRFFGDFIPWQFRDIALKRTDTNYISSYRRSGDRDAPSSPTYLYWPGTHQVISYHKTALWLNTLERRLSWEQLQKVMSTFFARWRFKHPTPEDFFATVNEVTGQDYTWFFDRVFRSSNRFDYSIEQLSSEPISSRGLVDEPGGAKFEEQTVEGMYRTTVVVRRLEAGQFPVDIVVRFTDGEQMRETWDGLARWHTVTYDRKVKAVSAQVDPERVLLLDTNYTNNSRALQPSTEAASTKWALKWMVWLQDLLMTYAFFV
jgi:Peptidase family M1 domain